MLRLSRGITDAHLAQVYADEYCARGLLHDLREAQPIQHPSVEYVSAFHGDNFLGALMAIQQTPYDIKVHSLLHRCGRIYCRDIMYLMMQLIFSAPSILRISVEVRADLKSVINLCLNIGFLLEGMKSDAFLLNGQRQNITMLGLTRKRWSRRLWAA